MLERVRGESAGVTGENAGVLLKVQTLWDPVYP